MFRGLLAIVMAVMVAASSLAVLSAQSRAGWTVMVYLDGDNDLEGYGLMDVEEMEAGLSGNGVNVVVLFDRNEKDYEGEVLNDPTAYPQWSDARILVIGHDEYVGFGSDTKVVADWGEVDMGDPRTLSRFISYAATNYPADHYALVIWDHGHGLGYVALDTTDKDYLTPREIAEALDSANIHIDLLGFDACLMATIETAYELRSHVDVAVFSEETEPGYGWDYTFLAGLSANPSMSAQDLGSLIVSKYDEFYAGRENAYTLSAVDLRKLDQALPQIRSFIDAAKNDPGSLKQVRSSVQDFGGGENSDEGGATVDLVDLLSKLGGTALASAASPALTAVEGTVIKAVHGPAIRAGNGLAIYYPLKVNYEVYVRNSRFGSDTGWIDAVLKAVNVEVQVEQPVQPGEGGKLFGGRSYQDLMLMSMGGLDFAPGGKEEVVVVASAKSGGSPVILVTAAGLRGGDIVEVGKYEEIKFSGVKDIGAVGSVNIDLDGDGLDEIVTFFNTEYPNGSTTAYMIVSEYKDGAIDYWGYYWRGFTVTDDVAGDFNGDGKPDVAMAFKGVDREKGEYFAGVAVMSGKNLDVVAEKDFTYSVDEGVVPYISSISSGDYDGDGVDEIFAALTEISFSGQTVTDIYTELQLMRVRGEDLSVSVLDYSDGMVYSMASGDIDPAKGDETVFVAAYFSSDYSTVTHYEVDIVNMYSGEVNYLASYQITPKEKISIFGVQIYDIDGDGVAEILMTYGKTSNGQVSEAYMMVLAWVSGELKKDGKDIDLYVNGVQHIYFPVDFQGTGRPTLVDLYVKGGTAYLALRNVTSYVETSGAVSGVVEDERGNPVANAEVAIVMPRGRLIIARAKTDSQGRFRFTNIPKGTYEIIAKWEENGRKRTARQTVTVEAGGETTVTVSPQGAPPMQTTTTQTGQQTTSQPTPTETTAQQTTAGGAPATGTTTQQQTTQPQQTQQMTTGEESETQPGGNEGDSTLYIIAGVILILIVGLILKGRKKSPPPPPPPPPPPDYYP